MEFFYFKKLVGIVLMPLPVSLILLITGMITYQSWAGKLSAISGIALLFISSTPFFPDYALGKLEQSYPQYDMAKPTEHIVVLGCSHTNSGSLPITSQIHSCSMIRIVEAMRILLANEHAKIYTSGFSLTQPFSQAEMNKRMLETLGVASQRVIINPQAKDTREEAASLKRSLKGQNFVLVTSASHMRRAMALFQEQGLSPVPAPTGHLVKPSDNRTVLQFVPSSKHLHKTERWWYEMLGLTWLQIRHYFTN